MPIALRTAVTAWVVAWFAIQVAGTALLVAWGVRGQVAEGPLAAVLGVLMVGWVLWAVALRWASVHGGSGRWRDDYAVAFRPVDLAGLVVGAVTQLVLVPGVYMPLRALWPGTFSEDAVSRYARRLFERADDPFWLGALTIAVVVGAPLVEEFVYRGLLQRSVATRVPALAATVLIAAVFAAIHVRPVEFPGLFVAGLVFGGALVVTGRIATPVLVHLGFNLAAVVLVWPA